MSLPSRRKRISGSDEGANFQVVSPARTAKERSAELRVTVCLWPLIVQVWSSWVTEMSGAPQSVREGPARDVEQRMSRRRATRSVAANRHWRIERSIGPPQKQ